MKVAEYMPSGLVTQIAITQIAIKVSYHTCSGKKQ
jgi:hypothetical protein